jgi:Ca-activated chloride channel family protein
MDMITHYLGQISWGAFHLFVPLAILGFIGLFSYAWFGIKTCRMVALLNSSGSFVLKYKIRRVVHFFLILLAVVTLLFACLRIQWGTLEQKVVQEGRDLFILLDISGSMKVMDCFGKSRLEYAKEKIKDFVLKLDQTRVGLILFSNSAFIQCPLTFDKKAFFMFVDTVDVEAVTVGSTMIDKGLSLVLDTYRSIEAKKHKLALILTDGEDFSHDLDAVKKTALDEQLSIFAIGIGSTKGAPIPLYDSFGKTAGYQKDTFGRVIVSRLNEVLLSDLTNKLSGIYVSMTHDNSDLSELVSIIHKQEKERVESTMVAEKIDQYWPFVVVSFCSLILEWIV